MSEYAARIARVQPLLPFAKILRGEWYAYQEGARRIVKVGPLDGDAILCFDSITKLPYIVYENTPGTTDAREASNE